MFKRVNEGERIDPKKINVQMGAGSISFKTIGITDLSFDYERLLGSAILEMRTLRIFYSLEQIKKHKKLFIRTAHGIEYTQGSERDD